MTPKDTVKQLPMDQRTCELHRENMETKLMAHKEDLVKAEMNIGKLFDEIRTLNADINERFDKQYRIVIGALGSSLIAAVAAILSIILKLQS